MHINIYSPESVPVRANKNHILHNITIDDSWPMPPTIDATVNPIPIGGDAKQSEKI